MANLKLTSESEEAWRVVVAAASTRGDLLLGITQNVEAEEPGRAPPDAHDSAEAADSEAFADEDALEEGYSYIMGRDRAPPSMFYGGRSLRCCFSVGDGSGPRIDYAESDGRLVDAYLSRLRRPGDWVEFRVCRGVLSAVDFAGHSFAWSSRIPAGTVWHPTLAWTGSDALLRLEFPEHFAATCSAEEAIDGK